MFFGNYPGKLDEKGRTHVPAVLARQVEEDHLMVAEWGDCLAAFPKPYFDQLAERLMELSKDPAKMPKVRKIISGFFAGSFKSGKLLLPQELRETKQFDKEIQIVGMLDHIEIWNQSEWAAGEAEMRKGSVRDDLNDLGLL